MSYEVIKIIKGHPYKYKVEGYREGGKVKQRVLKCLGRADRPAPAIFIKMVTVGPHGTAMFPRGLIGEEVGVFITKDQARAFYDRLKAKKCLLPKERDYLVSLGKQLKL